MKRSALKPSTKPLQRKTPMAPGTAQLKTTAPMKKSGYLRQRKPGKAKRADKNLADLCRGQECFLALPCVCVNGNTVPCHSNQQIHGKGMGIKADDIYTVPGCPSCHREIDQGMRFTREEKFAYWDEAYLRWEPVRAWLLSEQEACRNTGK